MGDEDGTPDGGLAGEIELWEVDLSSRHFLDKVGIFSRNFFYQYLGSYVYMIRENIRYTLKS